MLRIYICQRSLISIYIYIHVYKMYDKLKIIKTGSITGWIAKVYWTLALTCCYKDARGVLSRLF